MNILIIDGMGGGIGKSIIEHIKSELADTVITAVGTNSIATSQMIKAGARMGATGENAVVFNCKTADIILGPMGICFSGAMHGEISRKMAAAVCESPALKLLIPISKCNARIAGVTDKNMAQSIQDMLIELKSLNMNG